MRVGCWGGGGGRSYKEYWKKASSSILGFSITCFHLSKFTQGADRQIRDSLREDQGEETHEEICSESASVLNHLMSADQGEESQPKEGEGAEKEGIEKEEDLAQTTVLAVPVSTGNARKRGRPLGSRSRGRPRGSGRGRTGGRSAEEAIVEVGAAVLGERGSKQHGRGRSRGGLMRGRGRGCGAASNFNAADGGHETSEEEDGVHVPAGRSAKKKKAGLEDDDDDYVSV